MTATSFSAVLLRVDAAANLVLAAALPLLGWPFVPVASLLVVNGVACWRTAASPTRSNLRVLAAVDAAFTIAIVWFVVADPPGTAPWLRVALTALAAVVAAMAATKILLAQRHSRVGRRFRPDRLV